MWIYRPDMVKYQKINESIRLNSSIKLSTFLNIHYGAGTKVLRFNNSVQPKRKEALLEQKRGRVAQLKKYILYLLSS